MIECVKPCGIDPSLDEEGMDYWIKIANKSLRERARWSVQGNSHKRLMKALGEEYRKAGWRVKSTDGFLQISHPELRNFR